MSWIGSTCARWLTCGIFAAGMLGVSVLGGCGGSGKQSPGATLFSDNCTLCHSLIGNESLRRQGGDLLRYRFSRAVMLQYAREMPARRPLSEAQLALIVDYIRQVQASGGRH